MAALSFRYAAEPPSSRDARTLGAIVFDDVTRIAGDGTLHVAMPPLGTLRAEVWTSTGEVRRGVHDAIHFAADGELLFGAVVDDDDDVEAAARRAYSAMRTLTVAEECPHLLRVWNHVRDVNAGAGDEERYKRFCAGRHEALVAAGFGKHDFPAASGVGMSAGSLAIYFLASRTPGRQLENPRQVSAYEYPRQYGPRSPSFARATAATFGDDELVFVSGTASVVGHETRHAGDVDAQLAETLENIAAIVPLAEVVTMKVYVRSPADQPRIADGLARAVPHAQVVYVASEICRADLLLEIEAIARRRPS